MCDTLCIVSDAGTLFGKNSDRPPGEAQVVEPHAARPAGGTVCTQYLELPDRGAHAVLLSRPAWLRGAEHGVNEHHVAIGNEKVWTVDDAKSAPPALLGMDLVRLALERARTADEALDVLTSLLETHGQGGSGEEEHDEPYFSSFLVADPHGGWIVETSQRTWAAKPVGPGAAISNRISLTTDWTRASSDVRPGQSFQGWRDPDAPTGIADGRLVATDACVAKGFTSRTGVGPREMVATLRHHGTRAWGAPGDVDDVPDPIPTELGEDWGGITVCMHVRGYQATTASMVAELPRDAHAPMRAWVALGSPCVSIYVPVFPPALAPPELAETATWARFAALRDRIEADPDALEPTRAGLATVEAELWDAAEDAYATGSEARLARTVAGAWAPVDAALARLGV